MNPELDPVQRRSRINDERVHVKEIPFITTRARITPATVARMAAAGYDAKHAGHPGVTWASAVRSVREAWTTLAAAVADGTIDNPHQLFEAFSSGRDVGNWQGAFSPQGRKWQAVLSAMRIARTEESHD